MNLKSILAIAATTLAAAVMQGQAPVMFQKAKKHTGSPSMRAVASAPHKQVYAWMTRDRADLPLGIVSMYLDRPSSITSLFPEPNLAWAGTMAGDKYVFDRYRTYKDSDGDTTWDHIALSTISLTDGTITDIVDWSDQYYFVINDMTYDHSTGTLYAIARDWYIDDFLSGFQFEYSALFSINLNTGAVTTVKQFIDWESGMPSMTSPTYYTLAADINGNLYSIDKSGQLVKFDRDNDFAETVIGSTGLMPGQSTQSMEFDHSTGVLYWAADFQKDPSALAVVDVTTGRAQLIGNTGTDSHLVGLYIPFEVPQTGAPGSLTFFSATPDARGAKSITLTWANPTKTYGGANLTTISKIEVFRDETLITTLQGAPGEQMSYTDQVTESGSYTYTVAASNILGKGLATGVTKWVGHDVPDAVTDLGIGCNDDGSAQLLWEAPQGGLHGGWIDTQSLAYKITRYPDGIVVAAAATGTSFNDTSVTGMGRYSYEVEPYTADGPGLAARTVEIAIGSGVTSFPWNTVFADISEFNRWTVVNNNGGSSWEWKQRGLKDYDCFAMYSYDNANDGDDYLISPDLYLKKGATYRVRFNYRGANAYHTENMEVTFGQGKTAEAQATVLGTYTMTDGDGHFAEVDFPAIEADGPYNFAFHATSLKGNYNIYVTDVTVTQLTAGTDPVDPDEPELTAPFNLSASVDNEAGTVTLTWNRQEEEPVTANIEDDFESYPKWTINPTGKYDWSYIDGDKGIPYVDDWYEKPYPTDGDPLAAMIMAPYDLYSEIYDANPPHSGDKYLLFKSNFYDENRQRPAPAPDDYLISPRLNFGSEFVLSFYCKADPDFEGMEPLWNTEYFRVGYSVTGTDPDDFIWLTEEPEHITTTFNEWVKKAYAMPAEARYVCINYCTPSSGYWFMVDDIFIGIPANASAAPARKPATLRHYEVFIDNDRVATTTDTQCTVSHVTQGTHSARVTAVYEEGTSDAAVTSFTMTASGLGDIYGTDEPTVKVDGRDIVVLGAEGSVVKVWNLAGMALYSARSTGIDRVAAAPGIYLISIDGRTVKVTVK